MIDRDSVTRLERLERLEYFARVVHSLEQASPRERERMLVRLDQQRRLQHPAQGREMRTSPSP